MRRCRDPQAAVRTRCFHNHFANVLLRRETARIRPGSQDLQADQVGHDLFRISGRCGLTLCQAHRTSLASTCHCPLSSGNARHRLLTKVDWHRAGSDQETDVFRRTACGCRLEVRWNEFQVNSSVTLQTSKLRNGAGMALHEGGMGLISIKEIWDESQRKRRTPFDTQEDNGAARSDCGREIVLIELEPDFLSESHRAVDEVSSALTTSEDVTA